MLIGGGGGPTNPEVWIILGEFCCCGVDTALFGSDSKLCSSGGGNGKSGARPAGGWPIATVVVLSISVVTSSSASLPMVK